MALPLIFAAGIAVTITSANPRAPVSAMNDLQTTKAETKTEREARFGMFVHWGLYAIPAGDWNGKPGVRLAGGKTTVTVRALTMPKGAVMNLRARRLLRAS